MSEIERFSNLIGDIYDASLDPGLWPAVFEQVCHYVGGSAAHLFVQDAVNRSAELYCAWGHDPEFTDAYRATYGKLNPMFPSALFFNVEDVHQLIEIIPRHELCRTRFAKEWLQPQGYIDDVFCVMDKSPTTSALFEVARNVRDGVVDDIARERMALVAPHMRRAVLIGRVIDLKKVEAAALADSFDTLASGMFLVDAAGHVIHGNASGHHMLADGDVLQASGGRLAAVDAAAGHALLDSFAACAAGDAAVGRKGIAVPLKARSGGGYVANVLPLTAGARRKAGMSYAAVATVFVHKTGLDLPSVPEAIVKEYRLTPAEMRVLFAIVKVGGVPDVADVLGLSEGTIKTHLQHLFEKTGTARQADLVKLVAGYANALVG
jgi:DNA-binding CsgD family transcriptional regulator